MRSSSSLSFSFFVLFTCTGGDRSRAADYGNPSPTYRQIKQRKNATGKQLIFSIVSVVRVFRLTKNYLCRENVLKRFQEFVLFSSLRDLNRICGDPMNALVVGWAFLYTSESWSNSYHLLKLRLLGSPFLIFFRVFYCLGRIYYFLFNIVKLLY